MPPIAKNPYSWLAQDDSVFDPYWVRVVRRLVDVNGQPNVPPMQAMQSVAQRFPKVTQYLLTKATTDPRGS
jgi:hypothetical protein